MLKQEDGSFVVTLPLTGGGSGRVYDLEASRKAIEQFTQRLQTGQVGVEYGPPKRSTDPYNALNFASRFQTVDGNNVCGFLSDPKVSEGVIHAKFTPAGQLASGVTCLLENDGATFGMRALLKPVSPPSITSIITYDLVTKT